MTRFIFPIILIGLAVVAFFTYIEKNYAEVKVLQAQYQEYDQALKNAAELKGLMATLVAKQDKFDLADLDRLQKLLPDSVNNIRLVRDLEKLGNPINVAINNVVFDVGNDSATSGTGTQNPQSVAEDKKDYGTFNISLSMTGNYANFVSFLDQLDRSLRLIDVSSIAFTATNDKTVYRYDFKVKTYWLKN